MSEPSEANQILDAIRSALKGLKFGSVEVTVHDGSIVQLERKEKQRFNAASISRTRKEAVQ